MFTNLALIIVVISVVYCESDCDNVKCPHAPKHYKELGCTAIQAQDECCPSRYECPDKSSYALDKCYWNGKTYNVQERIASNETSGMCTAACFCSEGYPVGQPAEFRCAQVDCTHFFSAELNACVKVSTLDSCCPKLLCDEEERKTLQTGTCELEGKSYHIGELMYPDSEKCYRCICQGNFDNSTIIGNPLCREQNCGIGLRYFSDIREGCIPTYYGTEKCCPIQWRCPKDDDVLIPSGTRLAKPVDSKSQCHYGKLTLNIGDEIKSDNECDVCKCITPPMAHCVKKPNCIIE